MLRRLEQDGIAPDIARLSDEPETALSVALAGTGGLARKVLDGRPNITVTPVNTVTTGQR